jgi:hypothetical protein
VLKDGCVHGPGIAASEGVDQLAVGVFASAVFVGRGVQAAEGESDVAFGGVPQGFQGPNVPCGGCGAEQLKVEVVVRFVDLVYAKPLVGESLHDVIEALEVFVLEEQTGSRGDFGLDLVAQPVDAVQVLVGQGHNASALAALGDDQTLTLESPQRLTDGNEADSEAVRDPTQGEFLSRPQRASQDRSPDLFAGLIDDRRGLDRPHTALADLGSALTSSLMPA